MPLPAPASVIDARTARIERCAARAWPAGTAVERDGWLLRATPGVHRNRSNSALPLPECANPEDTLDTVEEFAAEHGIAPAVQVSPAAARADLDAELAARGYRKSTETLLLTADALDVATAEVPETAPVTAVSESLSPSWLAALAALDGDRGRDVGREVLPRIPDRAGYALAAPGAQPPSGQALFVAADGLAGVFCVGTLRAARGLGAATAMMQAGAEWALESGVSELYLQVTADNEAACRLYARLGFTVAHRYHYRIADQAG